MDFKKKQLAPSKRVCLRLKEARKQAHVSLSDLSKQTKISKKHLQALEECRFNDIPYAIIYKKNFVRRYAEALNLPTENLLNQFITEEIGLSNKQNQPKLQKINKNRFQNLPSLIRLSFTGIVVLALVGYLGWQVRSILRPPHLILFSPANGYVTEDPELLVHGEASGQAQIFINGQEINNGADGQFKEIINLGSGINTIVISAKKKHGKTTNIVRHVTLKNNQQFSMR